MPVKDLAGQVFNAFTVIELDRIENRRTFWRAMCECGRIKSIRADHLRSGNTKSCNECDRVQIDITGHVYGKLTVIKFLRKDTGKGYQTVWLCKCECGSETEKLLGPMRTGMVTSCGCEWHKTESNSVKWTGSSRISGKYWAGVLKGAAIRNIEVAIDIEYAEQIFNKQNDLCALTGIPLILSIRGRTASLDRIDSSLGYLPGNVQWVHKDINKMKNAFPQNYFIEMCGLVAQNAKERVTS